MAGELALGCAAVNRGWPAADPSAPATYRFSRTALARFVQTARRLVAETGALFTKTLRKSHAAPWDVAVVLASVSRNDLARPVQASLCDLWFSTGSESGERHGQEAEYRQQVDSP